MKLLSLKLSNFKGVKKLELEAQGEDLRIYGDNATGKSTIYDAFTWLLFDTDSRNKTEFGIKTWAPDGSEIHHLDHEVVGKFSLGKEVIELKKVYREKWVKRRGATERAFDGHETDHFIDGVPLSKTDYNKRIAELANEERFRILTSPTFFNDHLHWEDRRRILLEVCGDVTDEDVYHSSKKLAKLPEILGKRSIDDHRVVITKRRTEINKELERIPVRIDEANKALPDISAIKDPDNIDSKLAEFTKARAEKERMIAGLLKGDNTGEISQRIAKIDARLLDLETASRREYTLKVESVEAEVRASHNRMQEIQRHIETKKADIEQAQSTATKHEGDIKSLKDAWYQVQKQGPAIEVEVDEVCPTCGQDLPADKVEEAREKALASFNADKAQKLADINAGGKALSAKLKDLQANIEGMKREIAGLEESLDVAGQENAKLQGALVVAKATYKDHTEGYDYKDLVAQKEKLQKQLEGEQVDFAPEIKSIEDEIRILDEEADAVRKAKANLDAHQRGKERIEELKGQQKKLAMEYERYESELHLMDEFVRAKVGLLTDKINAKFEEARFSLFEIQVNGGIKEVCETTLDGVPWSDLNTGGAINVGLDIINTLSKHYSFAPPVFIDNAEAVTALTPITGQMIELIVSEDDKELRIEAANKGKATLFGEISKEVIK